MLKQMFFISFFLQLLSSVAAQDTSLYEKYWFVQSGDTMPYRILFPENYDASKSYPLVLFLHGRGESGDDNEKQLTHGARLFLRDSIRKKYPAIVVFPQCSNKSYWSNVQAVMQGSKTGKRTFYFVPDGEPTSAMQQVLNLVDNILLRYRITKEQVYVMGLSMGGMGTFEIVKRKPKLFAAAIPICGGANPATAKQLRKTKWWIFHGAKDDVVSPSFSEAMVEALRMKNASVKFTLYPAANHNSWDAAFAEPQLLSWLFSQKK